jgi:secretion/DNA translocation related TadE-like protein
MSGRTRALVGERGSVTILAAASLVLAAVLVLASVDIMRAAQGGARAQTAADAAALAAAQEIALPSGETPADMAAEFATRNGATLVSCTCQPGTAEAVVEVSVTIELVFVGLDRVVHARARAVIEGGLSG